MKEITKLKLGISLAIILPLIFISTFEIINRFSNKLRQKIDSELFSKASILIEVLGALLILGMTIFIGHLFLNVNLKSTRFIYFETLYYLNVISEKNNGNITKVNKILHEEIVDTAQKIFSRIPRDPENCGIETQEFCNIRNLKKNVRTFIEMKDKNDFKEFSDAFCNDFIDKFKKEVKKNLEAQFDEYKKEENDGKAHLL